MLVSGIVNDVQELTKQQLALFKHEMASDVRTTKAIVLSSGVGFGGLFLGVGLLSLMLVHWLNQASELPLWACYGLVGFVVLIAGAILVSASKKQLASFDPLPARSVKELKENVQCLMNQK
jgi:hypothetical protein